MHSFFATMEPWRRNDGSFHLYALPHETDRERFVAAQALLTGVEHLPLMPAPYLHCTVQRLAQFDDELTQQQLTHLGGALTRALTEVPAFDLDFEAPSIGPSAVTCEAAPSDAWDRLVAAARNGVVAALGNDPALPGPPHRPHLSLTYSTGAVEDGPVQALIDGAPPVGRVRIDELHLVSVTVRPELGIFDFTSLASWDLA